MGPSFLVGCFLPKEARLRARHDGRLKEPCYISAKAWSDTDEDWEAPRLLDKLLSDDFGASVEDGPWGSRVATYMDWAASGRLLKSFERFIQQQVYPFYANTHTEVSDFGLRTSAMVDKARLAVAEAVHAPREQYVVIFTGAGSTAALNLLVHTVLRGCTGGHPQDGPTSSPVVFIGPYEHHSNELMWREVNCTVVVVGEDTEGRVCLTQLESLLRQYSATKRLLIGCFSAGSNVTGVATDVDQVSVLMHMYGGLACFDYAAAGSYHLPHMTAPAASHPLAYKDAVAMSPHKMPGGPGSSGVLVARRALFDTHNPPRVPGGGTVAWVSPFGHAYVDNIEAREEAGTPNIIANIRCGMALRLAATISAQHDIKAHEHALMQQLVHGLMAIPGVVVLGADKAACHDWSTRLGIVSFLVHAPATVSPMHPASTSSTPRGGIHACWDPRAAPDASGSWECDASSSGSSNTGRSDATAGKLLHHHFVARLLSDLYGIQARSGCSCAGPYGFSLLLPLYRKLLGPLLAAGGAALTERGSFRSLPFNSYTRSISSASSNSSSSAGAAAAGDRPSESRPSRLRKGSNEQGVEGSASDDGAPSPSEGPSPVHDCEPSPFERHSLVHDSPRPSGRPSPVDSRLSSLRSCASECPSCSCGCSSSCSGCAPRPSERTSPVESRFGCLRQGNYLNGSMSSMYSGRSSNSSSSSSNNNNSRSRSSSGLSGCNTVGERQLQEECRFLEAMAEMGAPKAGWTRLSVKYLNTTADVEYALQAVRQVAEHGWRLLPQYQLEESGGWTWRGNAQPSGSTKTSGTAKGHATPMANMDGGHGHATHVLQPFPFSAATGKQPAAGHKPEPALPATADAKQLLRQQYLTQAQHVYAQAREWVARKEKGTGMPLSGLSLASADTPAWCWWATPSEAAAALLLKSPPLK